MSEECDGVYSPPVGLSRCVASLAFRSGVFDSPLCFSGSDASTDSRASTRRPSRLYLGPRNCRCKPQSNTSPKNAPVRAPPTPWVEPISAPAPAKTAPRIRYQISRSVGLFIRRAPTHCVRRTWKVCYKRATATETQSAPGRCPVRRPPCMLPRRSRSAGSGRPRRSSAFVVPWLPPVWPPGSPLPGN